MPRWIQCLCKWAVLTIRRQRERAGFTSCARGRDEAGAGSSPGDGLARRLAHCSRAPVESLEPRLLFSAAPAAEHDALFVPADRAVALDALLLNDTDADADPLSVVIDTPPTHGGVVPDGQGGLVYQPDAGYLGPDSFTYRASDGSQQSSVVAVAVTVGESATSAVDAGVDRWIELVGDALSEVGGAYLPSPTLASDAPGAVVSWAVDWGDGHAEPLAFDPVTGQPIVGPHTYWTPGTKTVRFTAIDGDARYDASIDVVVQDSVALVANDHYTTPADQPVSAPYAAAGVLGNDALDPAQAWSLTVRHPSDPNQDATLAAGSTGSASVDTGRGVFGFGVDGAFVYLPHAGQTGTDAIVYEVDNGQGTTDRGLIEIDVRDTDTQDRSPDAASWAVTVAKGAVFAIDDPRLGVLGRSSDPDGDRVRLATTQPSAPAQGSLTLNDDGTLVYDPQDPQFTGEVTIDYALDDGPGGQVWGQVTLTYIDHAPVATDTRMSATAGLSVEVPDAAGLLALGSDRDGDTLTLATIDGVAVSFIDAATPSSYFTAQGGLIELYEDGGFHYTPATGFVGEDAFTYTLTDGGHASEPATVRIDVGPGTLSLADDLYNARAKGILSVPAESGLLANDLDSHGRALMIENANTIYPTEQGGQVIYGPDGSFYYQPDAAFTGEDRFGYTVVDAAGHTHTAQVALVVDRRPPLAFDDAYTAGIGQSIAIDLLANDLPGPDGMAIHLHTLESLDAPQFGTLVAVDADAGLYTYTAPTGWSGTFALAYTVTDGVEISEPAELLITVLDEAVVAIDDSYELSHGQPLVVDGPGVLSNDVGPAGVLQVAQPGVIATRNGGQLDINADGSFTYTPEAGFVGTDTVAYRLAEVAGVSSVGEIVFEVTNAAPTAGDLALALDEDAGPTSVALPIADTDPADGGALTIDILAAPSNGQLDQANWTYTPDPHFAGQDRFTYAVTDTLGETAYGTVRLDVASLNDAPTADPVTLSLNPDDTLRVDLRQYIDDADGDVVSFVQTAGPGSVTADGVFSFDPAGTAGTSTAVFTVSDGGALPATFALTLDVANAAPVGYADAYVTHDGLELRVTGASGVLANDTDDYKQSVTAIGSSTVLTTATLGVTVTLDPNGGFVYQTPTLPAGTTQLTDTFTYTPADGHASGGATTVTILVTADDVIASDDRYAVKQGQIVEVLEPLQGLLRNDIDALDPTSNTALSVHAELKNTDQGGFVQLFADGTFYYASPDEHVGLDTFTYTVTNTNTGATASAAVRIDVRNTAPVAVGDRYELIAVEAGATPSAYSRAADQGLLLNDYDADGDAIHVQHLTIAGTTYPHSTPITVLDDAGEVAGTLVVFSDGAFDFTPAAGYVGDATVAYKLTDRAQSSTGQAVFDIVNRTPTPAADAYRLHVTDAAGDGAAMPSVLDNDYDADAHPFIAALPPVAPGQEPRLAGDSFTTDRGATVVFNSDGTFTYSADPGFVGVDSFTYAPTDGLEAIPQSAWTTVTIDVWNQLPLPAGDTIYAEVSYAGDPPQITGQLLTNDVLVNDHSGTNYQPGDPTSPNRALLIDPATGQPIDPAAGPGTLTLDQGTLELEPDGTFTFAPSPNYRTDGSGEYTAGGFVGTVSFRYLLEDEAERTEPVNVDLVLTNHAPQAADDVFVLTHALTIDGNVFAGHASADGDWDAEADDLTVELVYGPGDAASSFALNDDGTFSFVAAEGFDGVAQFSYRVLDGVSRYKRTSDPHTVGTVTIHAVNNTAQAGGDFVITSLDQPVDGDVLANDYYATGQGIVAESELVPGSAYGGTVELDTDGTYTFTPDAGYVGDAGFSYRLVVYADDGNGGQAVLSQSGETRVNVSVQPPVYRPVDKIFELTAGDLDGHVLTGVGSNVGQDFIEPGYTLGDVVVSAGTIGQAAGDRVVMNADGSFVFVPADPNGATRFAFDYTAGVGAGMAGQGTGSVVIYYDGTSALFDNDHTRQWADHALEGTTIEIDAAALVAMYFDTPAVVDPTTIDVEQQPWWGTFEKGTNSAGEPVWYYTADTRGLASSSTDAVVFTVKDLVGTSSRRLTLLINVQPKPQPKDDWAATPHDTAVTIDVLANDGADADGFGLDRPITANSVDAVQVVNPPTSGTAVVINKQIRYTPFANTVGPVTFEYRVIDKLGNPHDATVTVQVGPEPIQPPTAGSATADQVEFGGTMWDTHLVPITASARSPILHASIVAQGQYGYAVVNQFSDTSVELIYTLTDRPGVGVTQDTITYLIQDAHGESAQGTLTIPIDRGDDPATPADRPAYVDPNHDTSQNPASPLTLTDATDTWYASDHSIKVQVTGTATFVFSANGVTITGASQGASITATYVGDHADSAPEFTVDWQNSNATHNLTIQSSTSIAGIDFEGDLIAEVGGNIEQAITAKTIDLSAYASGKHYDIDINATLTADGGDLYIRSAANIFGDLHATGDITSHKYGNPSDIRGDLTSDIIDAGGDVLLTLVSDSTFERREISVGTEINAGGGVDLTANGGIDATINYTTALILNALDGALTGTYTNTGTQVSETDINARSIAATIDAGDSPAGSIESARDITGSITAERFGTIHSYAGSIHSTITVGDLDYLHAGVDLAGEVTGTGTLGYAHIERDLAAGGKLTFEQIDDLEIGRDWFGEVHLGDGGYANNDPLHIGSRFIGKLTNTSDEQPSITAGRYLFGEITAENATNSFYLHADESLAMWVTAPLAHIASVTAGIQNDIDRPGTIEAARIKANSIGTIAAYAETGAQGPDAGLIGGSTFELTTGPLGGGGPALNTVYADGRVSGLTIHIPNVAAADTAIGSVRAAQSLARIASMSITTPGSIGSIQSGGPGSAGGDLELTKLSAGHVGTLSATNGSVSGEIDLAHGIDEIKAGIELSANITTRAGDLGLIDPNRIPTIVVGAVVSGDLTAANGSIGAIVSGVRSAGGISGDITANHGEVRGLTVINVDNPFETSNQDMAWQSPGRGQDVTVPDSSVVQAVMDAAIPPREARRVGFAQAGAISGTIKARTLGPVNTMGAITGKIIATGQLPSVRAFGAIGDDAVIVSGLGELQLESWGIVGGAIHAQTDLTIHAFGTFKATAAGGQDTYVTTWSDVGQGADIRGLLHAGVWSRQSITDLVIDAALGTTSVNTWSDASGITMRSGKTGRIVTAGEINQARYNGTSDESNLVSLSFGDQVWLETSSLRDQYVVSGGNLTHPGGEQSGDTFLAITGGYLDFESELKLESGELTMLVHGEFRGKASVGFDDSKVADDDQPSSIKLDAGSVSSSAQLSARHITIASNGDASGTITARDALMLDVQGDLAGTHQSTKGGVQVLAGKTANATITGQLGVVVQAQEQVKGTVQSPGGHLQVTALNATNAQNAIDGQFTGYASASLIGWGDVKATAASGSRLTEGGLDVFAKGNVSADAVLRAGGQVGVEAWGEVKGTIHAGQGDAGSEHDAVVIAHAGIDATIDATGWVQAVSLQDLAGTITSANGGVALQAGGELGATVTAKSDIDALARSIAAADFTSTHANLSAIALTAADFGEVIAKGNIELVADQSVTADLVHALGETDPAGIPTLRPQVNLVANAGTLDIDQLFAPHGDVSAYAALGVTLTTAPPSPPEPDPNADPPEPDPPPPPPLPRSVSALANADVAGKLHAQQQATAIALGGDAGTSAGSITLTEAIVTADGGSLQLFARGAIGGETFTATSAGSIDAAADLPIVGTYAAGAEGLSLASLQSIDATATTTNAGNITLFAGNTAEPSGAFGQNIVGSVTAAGSAELLAAGKVSANVTANDSAAVTALTGDAAGSITTLLSTGVVSVYTPANVTGTIAAGHDATVIAAGDLTAPLAAANDAQILLQGIQSATITAGADASVSADRIAAAITAGQSAAVASATGIDAVITAHTGLSAIANTDLAGNAQLIVLGRGDLAAVILGDLHGQATTHDGNLNLAVGGAYTGSATAGWQSDLTGSIDLLAMNHLDGEVTADADANLTILGNLTENASVTAANNPSAAAAGDVGTARLTLAPNATAAGDVLGPVNAPFGHVNLVANSIIDTAVSAGSDPATHQGNADITLAGTLTSQAAVSAYLDARVIAFGDLAGSVTTAVGDVDLTTAQSFDALTVNAGNDLNASANQASTLTANAGRHLRLDLAAPADQTHHVDLQTTAGSIAVNTLGHLNGPITAGDHLDLFVLGDILGQENIAAGGDLELLASGQALLGSVTAAGDLDLATPDLLTATAVTAGRSLNIFVGKTTAINGLVLAQEHANLTSIDLFSALGVGTHNGNLAFTSQQAVATNFSAGIDNPAANAPSLAVFAGDSIYNATYYAPGDITLVASNDITANNGDTSATGPAPIDAGGTLRLLTAAGDIDARARANDIALIHTDQGNLSGYFNTTNGNIETVSVGGDMTFAYLEAYNARIERVEVFGQTTNAALFTQHLGRFVGRDDIASTLFYADQTVHDIQAFLNAELDVYTQAAQNSSIGSIQALGDITGWITADTVGEILSNQTITADIQATANSVQEHVAHGLEGLPEQHTLTWHVQHHGTYSVKRIEAEVAALSEALRALQNRIADAQTAATGQRTATDAALAKAQTDLDDQLQAAVHLAMAGFESVTKDAGQAPAQTDAELARVADDFAVALRRGVTDTRSDLADLAAQSETATVRSAAAVAFAHLTLDDSLARLVTAAQGNQQTMLQSRAGAAQAYAGGQAYRDRDFAFAANKALEELIEAAKEEAADRLQDTLNTLSLLIGFVPIVGTLASAALDLLNASISLARGNYEEAAFYGLAALPIVGDAAQGVRLGAQLARKAGGATTRQAAKGVKTGATQLTKNTDSVLGRAMHRCVLGNSFTAGTGVVTGVAADGGLLTTDIATLAVGDVVLANDQYTPGAEPRYALVTGVSHRTVHALHHVSYVTDAGESETLETTEGHEFYARRLTGQAGQTGWLKAQDLQPGDQLLTPDGTWATVTANTLELAPEGVTVYNLTVSDGSTYYVDDGQGNAAAVWVHNCPDVVPKALLYAYGKRLAKDTNVYVAYRRGQVVYVGITKQDPAKRLKQHNGFWGGYKNFDDVKRVSTNITRRQARAIEQAFIEKYTLQKLENRINSISSLRTWYKTAIKWGADELPSILKTI